MNEEIKKQLADLAPDPANLYREDTITDLKVATLQRFTPINTDGTEDSTRPVKYVAQTSLMTQMGAIPINAEIEASSLEEALNKYGDSLQKALDEMMEEAQRRQIEDAGKIVVPKAGPTGGLGPADKGGLIY